MIGIIHTLIFHYGGIYQMDNILTTLMCKVFGVKRALRILNILTGGLCPKCKKGVLNTIRYNPKRKCCSNCDYEEIVVTY